MIQRSLVWDRWDETITSKIDFLFPRRTLWPSSALNDNGNYSSRDVGITVPDLFLKLYFNNYRQNRSYVIS